MNKKEKNKDLYEKAFVRNINKRVEYGDVMADLDFFIKQGVKKEARILEVGCNIGTLTNKLHEVGYRNILACDIAPSAIKYGKRTYQNIADKLVTGDGTRLPFENKTFDVVISFDLVEHIPEVDKHFQEVYRVLGNGGIYVFKTVNKLINVPWEIMSSKSFTKWKIYHCSLHTYYGLISRIEKNGFTVEKIEKNNVATEYNMNKIKKILGLPGILLIKLVNRFPIQIFPHFWCVVRKKQ